MTLPEKLNMRDGDQVSHRMKGDISDGGNEC